MHTFGPRQNSRGVKSMICRRIQSLSIRSAAPKPSGRMRPMSITVRLALLAVIAVVFPAIARAADQSPFDDTVFGNWGGLRDGQYDDGIALGIEYRSETASKLRGGPKVGCATQTNGRSAQSIHVPET